MNFDEGCTSLTANCDPIVGGVEMGKEWDPGPCTIGLPIFQGTTEGYITAGHCVGHPATHQISTFEEVYQPEGGSQVGEAIQIVWNDNCDCAFVEHIGGEDTETKVWLASNSYVAITSYTDRVNNGELVIMTGAVSGPKSGVVNDRFATSSGGGINLDVVELTTDITVKGDSGAPYTNLAKNNFFGIHKGDHPSTGNSIFMPWVNVESELNL